MAVNDMTFEQASTFLNAVQQQVTGVASVAPTTTADFVAVATTVLKTGYDPVLNAINQVLGRTIFSIRPYSAKFRLAEITETAFGNHTRKLSIADRELVDDERYKYPLAYDSGQTPPTGDGLSVDMFKLRKPQILQTNFYGSQVWEDWYTIFRDQLECAFTSPAELGRFVTMVTQNSMDKLTQYREDAGRACVLNFIGGILDEGDAASTYDELAHRVIPVVTLYNAATSQSLTLYDLFKPLNFRPFVQFVYTLIQTVSDLMEQRSIAFQTVVNNMPVMRHTPKRSQKMMILEQFRSMFDMMGLANTYRDGYLVFPNGVRVESVAYWQGIESPWLVDVIASRIKNDGTIAVAGSSSDTPVLGVLFDEEALGYATTQSWQAPTPLNAAGGYWNMFVHETEKVYNDHSEKGVVFTLT